MPIVVKVKCTSCGATREIKQGEIPPDDFPMCDKCFMPMEIVKATVKK